jgi:murein DD-endopeptidase MepM/ murein hydrolase activator NlpD
MATVADSLRRSSINIQNISKSLVATKGSVATVNESVGNISRIIATNTRIKRDLFTRSQTLISRREEASQRREREDAVEASQVSSSPARGFAFSAKSDKGPLGRLLGFLGFVTAGWIVENLPTWIFMGQEFVSRIQTFGRAMYDMVGSMQLIIKSFGDVLKNSFNAIVRLDFDEFSEGSVAQSFDELNLAVQGLGDDITETFRLFTTPLTEALETGEQAPGLGEDRQETMFPDSTQQPGVSGVPTYTGPETTSSGTLNPQAAYAYIRQLGVSHVHALGILANIQGESGFQIGVSEKGGTKQGVGLFQYSYPSRKRRFLESVPDYKTNWKGQINYALTKDENTPLYLKKQFNSPEEAADDWMRNWENPSKGVYSTRRKVHNEFIKNFKSSSGQQQRPTATPQTPLSTNFAAVRGTSGTVAGGIPLSVPYSPFKPGSGAVITSGKGYRPSTNSYHKGYDLAAPSGTPLYAYFPGKVTHIGLDGTSSSAGYGNWVVWKDDIYGAYHFFGHMLKAPSVRVGDTINQGTLMGYVGSTGISSGPHLHWEISNTPPQSNGQFTSLEDPGTWLRNHPLKKRGPSSAQISSQSRQQPASAMTPERKGSQIMIIDGTKPQVSQASYPSAPQSSYTPTISEFKLLNNFIKNKLLIDLAYL